MTRHKNESKLYCLFNVHVSVHRINILAYNSN